MRERLYFFLSAMQPSTVIVVICIEGLGFLTQSRVPAQGPYRDAREVVSIEQLDYQA